MPNFYFNYSYSRNLTVEGDLNVNGSSTLQSVDTQAIAAHGNITLDNTKELRFLGTGAFYGLITTFANNVFGLMSHGSWGYSEYMTVDASIQNSGVTFHNKVIGQQIGNDAINRVYNAYNNVSVGAGSSYTPAQGTAFVSGGGQFLMKLDSASDGSNYPNGLYVWDGTAYLINTNSSTSTFSIQYMTA